MEVSGITMEPEGPFIVIIKFADVNIVDVSNA